MLQYYFGTDQYRIRQALVQAIATARANGNIRTITCNADDTADRQEFERALKYPSFFGETSVVALCRPLADADTANAISDILTAYDVPRLTDVIVLAAQEAAPRPSGAVKKLTAYLQKNSSIVANFDPLTAGARNQWIHQFCAARSCTIDAAALALLNERIAEDTWSLANELEKLCAYAGHQTISRDAIAALVPIQHEVNEFELTDALYAHNKRHIISTLYKRIAQGTPEQLLLGTLAAGIRTLLWVGDLASRGLQAAAIARMTTLHPFVVSKALRGARLYDPATLQKTQIDLASADRMSKDGQIDLADRLFSAALEL